jgi:transposase
MVKRQLLRDIVIEHYKNGESCSKIFKFLKINLRAIQRWIQIYKELNISIPKVNKRNTKRTALT